MTKQEGNITVWNIWQAFSNIQEVLQYLQSLLDI